MFQFDESSYFRLQQTCRAVNELIRSSRSISVHVANRYTLQFNAGRFVNRRDSRKIDPEALYGTRLRELETSEETTIGFEQFCACLKKHRITCRSVHMPRTTLTREQCVTVLRILKPVGVLMNSVRSDRFEALLHLKTLKRVEVSVKQGDLLAVATKLISTFQEVTLTIWQFGTEPLSLLRTLLPILRDKRCPNLRTSRFFVFGDWGIPPIEDFEEVFRYSNPTVKIQQNLMKIHAHLDMPRYCPGDSFCKVEIRGGFLELKYCG